MEERWEAAVFSSIYLSPIQAESHFIQGRAMGVWGGGEYNNPEGVTMLDRYNFLKCIPCWCSEDEQRKVSASKEREKDKRTVSY